MPVPKGSERPAAPANVVNLMDALRHSIANERAPARSRAQSRPRTRQFCQAPGKTGGIASPRRADRVADVFFGTRSSQLGRNEAATASLGARRL